VASVTFLVWAFSHRGLAVAVTRDEINGAHRTADWLNAIARQWINAIG
jgi:hypothetical protein